MRTPGVIALCLALWATEAAADPMRSAVDECIDRADEGIVEICGRATEQRPKDPAVLRGYARSLIAIGSFDAAVRVQQRILDLRPDDWSANYDLAGTLGFVRRYSEALPPMLHAVQLRPDHIPGHQAAAVIYEILGLHKEAVAETRRAADLGSVLAMFDMVRYYETGLGVPADTATAFRWLKRAAENGHVYAMRRMIDVYLEGGYGQAPDDAEAEAWASRHRAAWIWH